MEANNEIKVSKYTKVLVSYLMQVERWHKELIELEREFEDATEGWELIGLSVNDAWINGIKNVLKEQITDCVKTQLEWSKGKEV